MENVNRIVQDLSFVEDAFNLLPPEQRNKENLVKMLLVFANRWGKVQRAAITLAYGKFVDNAKGELLDTIASRLFIRRGGQDDTSLRGAIKLRALTQDNEGTRDEIVKLLEIVTGSSTIEVIKGADRYVEVVAPFECLDIKELKIEISDIFPVDTRLVVGDMVTGQPAFGCYSLGDTETLDSIGVLGSVNDSASEVSNNTPVIIVSNERGV